MKKIFLFTFAAIIFIAIQNNYAQEKVRMTPEILWSFGRISNVEVSPDNSTVLYAVRYYDIEKNKSQNDFYIVPVTGGTPIKITNSTDGKFSAKWRPDGKRIGFLSTKSGSVQLWEMNPDGTALKQITDIEGGINEFKYAPNGKKILFTKDVKLDKNIHDLFPDLPLSNARLETDLMYRHWDNWHDYSYSHIFYADYNEGTVGILTDIIEGERYDSPLNPFGGIEEIDWSPDGTEIAYTCKKMTGKEYSLSTNSDIYIYNLSTKQTRNITDGMKGFDKAPSYSPDGKMIAWTSMERDGYESDLIRLFIMNPETGEKIYATEGLDQNVDSKTWSDDGTKIYFTSGIKAMMKYFLIHSAINP